MATAWGGTCGRSTMVWVRGVGLCFRNCLCHTQAHRFPVTSILQPGLLDRGEDARFVEKLGMFFMSGVWALGTASCVHACPRGCPPACSTACPTLRQLSAARRRHARAAMRTAFRTHTRTPPARTSYAHLPAHTPTPHAHTRCTPPFLLQKAAPRTPSLCTSLRQPHTLPPSPMPPPPFPETCAHRRGTGTPVRSVARAMRVHAEAVADTLPLAAAGPAGAGAGAGAAAAPRVDFLSDKLIRAMGAVPKD